jgi:hypothetical protein
MALKSISVTPTITASGIYADLDTLGDLMEISGALSKETETVKLLSVSVIDEGDQGAAMELLFFNQSITVSADNAALSIADADAINFVGRLAIAATDYSDAAVSKMATKEASIPMKGADLNQRNTSLFCIAQSKGTPTYAAVDDLTFVFTFEDGL